MTAMGRLNTLAARSIIISRSRLHLSLIVPLCQARHQTQHKPVDEDPDSRESRRQECIRTVDAGFPVYVVINDEAESSAPPSFGKFARRFVEISAGLHNGA